jgi:ribosomal protein S6--L-glutamate ligase
LTNPSEIAPYARLIPDNHTLRAKFKELQEGDVFIGRLRLKRTEELMIVDLLERGVKLFPAGLAQLSSRSKVLQARIFSEFLTPITRAIHDLHDLMAALNQYQGLGVSQVVTKKDRANAGMGINLWSSTEAVFNQASCGAMPFPFVLQPYCHNCRDIRVIILDDYQEAYWRDNSNNFRNNLHVGGISTPASLSTEQQNLCRKVMARGRFPYAHLDLMVSAEGETFLAEINLRGGIKGAAISPAEYQQKIAAIHQRYRLAQGL